MNVSKSTFTNEPKGAKLKLGVITLALSYDPLHGVTAITEADHSSGTANTVFLTDEQMVFLRDWFNNSVVVTEVK